ncbi:MAG: 50S ribosomal protein L29 [Alteromonadaceae bacterium]|nr:MAG: 50S ribosomal protein L29 [Alteromonadaceae bacterium]
MKVNDLNAQTVEELNAELAKQLESQFKLRMQKSTGQLNQLHILKQVRRDIARIKTVLTQKSAN